ncbi:MAG TPA: nucleoside triphosphate pyrophosphohydrolase family protein [Fimbriimonas sp.]|nr:nucleoside triphosphate pyrophosphohydrolase family protein [Fimbriimonas sp.]
MTLDEYQSNAVITAQSPSHGESRVIALLGLSGETGELLSEYKKYLRDGEAHRLFPSRVKEELGDILWYVGWTASLFGLTLSDVAYENLRKTRARWGDDQLELVEPHRFDHTFPEAQQLPDRMLVELQEQFHDGRSVIRTYVNGNLTGDPLTDNSFVGDGYRFHDVFHFSYAAVLGWSPVVRLIMGRKRRGDSMVDEVEDGGRAKVIEEGISAMAFAYAQDYGFLENKSVVDRDLLHTIQKMTAHLEVGACTMREWESAILQGFNVWREIQKNQGGTFLADLSARTITFVG